MTRAVVYLISSLLIFLILTEAVTFVLSVDGDTVSLEINFTVFALRLSRSKKASDKNSNRARRIKFRPRINAILSFAKRVIAASDIRIMKCRIDLPEEDPAKSVIRHAYAVSAISSLLAFAELNAKKFYADDITVSTSDNTNIITKLDLKLTVSLLRMITASAVLLKLERR